MNKQNIKVEPVRIPFYSHKEDRKQLRIGLLALSSDPTVEFDWRRMLNQDEVAFFVSRVAYEDVDNTENYWAIAEELTRATSLLVPGTPLDVIAYGCTAGTVGVGVQEICDRILAARPGVPCATPITAACKGFKKLGVRRIALLFPYPDEVAHTMREFLASQDILVVRMASFKVSSDWEKALIPPEVICEAALEIAGGDAEGVFISCTALKATEAIETIESQLGKPVITSNQALLWESLRLAGYQKPIYGYGRLMQE
ncbi:MAG: hypothetical protein WBA93_09540 [Microcoleaceae cyanobacterium]